MVHAFRNFPRSWSHRGCTGCAHFGNSGDWNRNQRTFIKLETFASITGVEYNLLGRFATNIEVISSELSIDIENVPFSFRDSKTIIIFMTPDVPFISQDGPVIIELILLSIGTLSEEAAEERGNILVNSEEILFMQYITDVLNRLWLKSDPCLSCSNTN